MLIAFSICFAMSFINSLAGNRTTAQMSWRAFSGYEFPRNCPTSLSGMLIGPDQGAFGVERALVLGADALWSCFIAF